MKRKQDNQARSHFRTDRFELEDGQWFFRTREGTTEGPFSCEFDARARLEVYIRVQQSGMLTRALNYAIA